MIKSNTLTFEQIEPAFHKWAKFFCSKDFDYWELINSAWAYGGVRFLPQSKIRYASQRIKYDMIDYMRNMNGGRSKFRPGIFNVSDLAGEDNQKKFDNYFGCNENQPKLDTIDFFDWLTNSLKGREKQIIKLRFMEGYTFEEISIKIALHQTTIFMVYTKALNKIQQRLIQAGHIPKVCSRKIKTFYVIDKNRQRFYNRLYYLKNKEKIQRNRAQLKEVKVKAGQ